MGFEPTPPKRLVPETSALDRSAIQPFEWRALEATNAQIDGDPVGAGFRPCSSGTKKCRDWESHPGSCGHNAKYCSYTISAIVPRSVRWYTVILFGAGRHQNVGPHVASRLAQLVERKTFNLVVVGSSPTVGGRHLVFSFGCRHPPAFIFFRKRCRGKNPREVKIMLQEGLEPPTLGLLDPCSTI